MDVGELEKLVVSTVQETQLKLGPANGSESLYMPLASIAPDGNIAAAAGLIEEFKRKTSSYLGDVECTILDDRVRVVIPRKGAEYVSKLPVSPVLATMVDSVSKHMSLDQLRDRMTSEFGDCIWKNIDGDGFQCVAYFEKTDPNVYCIGSEYGHLVYHRFSRSDYSAFGYGL